jgi:hypothetical protein
MTRWVAVAAVFGLAGCAGTAPTRDPAARPLVSPVAVGDRAVSQVVRASVGARDLTLNCVVTVKEGAMTVVGLNAVGVRLFTVRYDGSMVGAERAPGVPASLEPERLLADLQLVYWPLESLRPRLEEQGWQLSEPDASTRRLRQGERLVAEVHYEPGATAGNAWTGRSRLVNFSYGYSLQIDSAPL